MSRAVRIALLLTLLAVPVAVLWLWPDGQRTGEEQFVLIDGRVLSGDDLRGQPLLVNFWATSCGSCIEDIPKLVSLHADYHARGLTLIGVAMPHDPPDRVVSFARARQLPYPVALDIEARMVNAYGRVAATPTHILIDADGRIRDRHTGPIDLDETRRKIETLLGES